MTAAPPMLAPRPAGNVPQQYLHRARMFRAAAVELSDYSNAGQNWPKYALLTHAIELSLKAFVQRAIETGMPALSKEPRQHDLLGWYLLAVHYGLRDEPGVKDNIDLLNELHLTHYTRYPQERTTPLPDASAIADSKVDHLISTATQAVNPR
jgi:hypothetical protein